MSKKILLPIKFSTACDNAFAVALQLARCCDARFHILHVLDYHLEQLDKPDEKIAQLTWESEKKFAQKYLPLLADFKNFAFNCWEGDGPVEAARFAKLIEADFIVIGCHSKGDQPSIVRLGTFGETLLEWAPCPVMLVPYSRKK